MALAFVSAVSANSDSSGTATVATAASVLAATNHVFVYVRWESGDTTVGVTDTAGNTYTPLTKFYSSAGGQWFYTFNATGHASNIYTATFAATRSFKNIRVTVLSGVATGVVQKSATAANVERISIPDDLIDVGTGAAVLLGESSFNADFTRTFSGGLVAFTKTGSSYNYADTAYALYPSGGKRHTYEFTGSTSSNGRVFLQLTVESDGSVSPRTFDLPKMNSYAVTGPAVDAATFTKINSYAVIGPAVAAATFTKMDGYAVTGPVGATATKLTGYTVVGAHLLGTSASKIIAYAVTNEEPESARRSVVFVVT